MQGDTEQARPEDTLDRKPVPAGDTGNHSGVNILETEPGVVHGRHMLSVGLSRLPFLVVFALGEGVVEEPAADVGGKS